MVLAVSALHAATNLTFKSRLEVIGMCAHHACPWYWPCRCKNKAAWKSVHIFSQSREITEFGRKLEFPASWHGSERLRTAIWYHCIQRTKLVEFDPGQVIIREGQTGQHAYWVLSGDAVVRSTAAIEAEARRIAEEEAAAAAAAAEAAAAALAAEQAALASPKAGTPVGVVHSAAASRTASMIQHDVRPSTCFQNGSLHTSSRPSAATSPRVAAIQLASGLPPAMSPASPGSLAKMTNSTTNSPRAQPAAPLIEGTQTLTSPKSPPKHSGQEPACGDQQASQTAPGISGDQGTGKQTLSTGSTPALNTARDQGSCSGSSRDAVEEDAPLALWDMFGEDAFLDKAHTYNVVAVSKVSLTGYVF